MRSCGYVMGHVEIDRTVIRYGTCDQRSNELPVIRSRVDVVHEKSGISKYICRTVPPFHLVTKRYGPVEVPIILILITVQVYERISYDLAILHNHG